MDYRKPAFRAVILAVISCAVIAACFLTDPKKEPEEMEQPVPVSGLMGLDCRYMEEITAPFFLERTYIGSIPESDASFTVAESFGYEIDDHIVDLDGDSITELVCNCQFGDGAQRVFIYRQNGSRIERGYLELKDERLDDIMPADWEDWSVLSIIEKYNADTGGVEVGYDSEDGWKPAAVLHLENFTFEEYGVILRQ